MKKYAILLIFVLSLSSCGGSENIEAAQTTSALTAVAESWTPTAANTSTPLPTATPISLQNAIQQGLFSKKGVLKTSITSDQSYQVITAVTSDGSWLVTENGAWDLDRKKFFPRTFSTLITYGKTWARMAVLENGDIAVITTDSDAAVAPHSSAEKTSGKIIIQTLDMKSLNAKATQSINFEFEDSIEEMTLSPDGLVLAIGLHNGNLYLWNTSTNEQVVAFNAHKTISEFGRKFAFREIVFNHDGSLFATSGMENIIKIWRTQDFSEVASIQGTRPAFSPDGKYLACVYDNLQILVQPLDGVTEPFFLKGHDTRTLEMVFSNDSQLLLSVGWDNIRVWSITDQSLIDELQEKDGVVSIVITPDNTKFYVSYHEGGIGIWGQ